MVAKRTNKQSSKKSNTVDTSKLPVAWIDSINIPDCPLKGVLEVAVMSVDLSTDTADVILPNGEKAQVKGLCCLNTTKELNHTKHLWRSVKLRGGSSAVDTWKSYYGLVEGRIREAVVRVAVTDYVNDSYQLEVALVDENSTFEPSKAFRTYDTAWYDSPVTASKLEAETIIHEDGTVEKRGGEFVKYALSHEQTELFNAIGKAIEAARAAGIILAVDIEAGRLVAVNDFDKTVTVEYNDPAYDCIPECLWAKGADIRYMGCDDAFMVSEA